MTWGMLTMTWHEVCLRHMTRGMITVTWHEVCLRWILSHFLVIRTILIMPSLWFFHVKKENMKRNNCATKCNISSLIFFGRAITWLHLDINKIMYERYFLKSIILARKKYLAYSLLHLSRNVWISYVVKSSLSYLYYLYYFVWVEWPNIFIQFKPCWELFIVFLSIA